MQGFDLYGSTFKRYLTVTPVMFYLYCSFLIICSFFFYLKSHLFSFLMFGTYFISLPLSLPRFIFFSQLALIEDFKGSSQNMNTLQAVE